MQYSPKLKKKQWNKSKTFLKKMISLDLSFYTHREFLNHVQTSYSCAHLDGENMLLKLSSKELGIEKAKQIAGDTFNMVVHLTNHITTHAQLYMDAEEQLTAKLKGSISKDGGMTSHSQQNN
jgi:hypothetical protein